MVKETYDLEPFSSSSTDPDISIYAISFVPTKRTGGGGAQRSGHLSHPPPFPPPGPLNGAWTAEARRRGRVNEYSDHPRHRGYDRRHGGEDSDGNDRRQ